MKDTQGIISSGAVCHSCHEGYALDLRDSVWNHQSHTTFKKPSKNTRIPHLLRHRQLKMPWTGAIAKRPPAVQAKRCTTVQENVCCGREVAGQRMNL